MVRQYLPHTNEKYYNAFQFHFSQTFRMSSRLAWLHVTWEPQRKGKALLIIGLCHRRGERQGERNLHSRQSADPWLLYFFCSLISSSRIGSVKESFEIFERLDLLLTFDLMAIASLSSWLDPQMVILLSNHSAWVCLWLSPTIRISKLRLKLRVHTPHLTCNHETLLCTRKSNVVGLLR